jgi:hypothetical protein
MKKSHVARVIHPNGEVQIKRPANGEKFTLEELQEMVGGYIELVHLPRGNGHATAYVNADGKLKGREYNAEASAIYGREPTDVIVGPMVIVSTESQKKD